MNLKFDLIRLTNEDVIATSSCEHSRLGCYYIFNSKYYYDYIKADGSASLSNEILVGNIPDGIVPKEESVNYYYHADENGGFIEWCPAGESDHTNDNSTTVHNIQTGGQQ